MAAVCSLLGVSAPTPQVRRGDSSRPVELHADAPSGQALFGRAWTTRDGVGPGANALSCAACHSTSRGAGIRTSAEAMVLLSDEESDPSGGHVFRQLLIRPGRAVTKRPLPRQVFRRRPPSLFGLGLLETISAAALAEIADPDDRDRDGISGRLPRESGRFGWKARFPTLRQAVAAAFVNELGLTNPVFGADAHGITPELSDGLLDAVTTFVRELPAPIPTSSSAVEPGRATFRAIGCATCHREQLPSRTGPVAAYTDLLLHDMGQALADGFAEGDSTAREFRTTPLWGVSASGPPLLHDGRAPTLDAAIRAHDGEAAHARARYEQLPARDRGALIAFLKTL